MSFTCFNQTFLSEPTGLVHWVANASCRGSFNIVSICVSTIIICVWSAIHKDIPTPDDDDADKYAASAAPKEVGGVGLDVTTTGNSEKAASTSSNSPGNANESADDQTAEFPATKFELASASASEVTSAPKLDNPDPAPVPTLSTSPAAMQAPGGVPDSAPARPSPELLVESPIADDWSLKGIWNRLERSAVYNWLKWNGPLVIVALAFPALLLFSAFNQFFLATKWVKRLKRVHDRPLEEGGKVSYRCEFPA